MQFLGQFKVSLAGQPISGWRYDKVRALLVYLACEGQRTHSRDELAALLWPDSDNAAARKSLRQALTILRTAVGDETAVPPFLLITRESLQFNPESHHTLDVRRFTSLLQQYATHTHTHTDLADCPACLANLAEAVGLYQGDLLAGFSLPASVPFEEWLIFSRERLRLQGIEALGRLSAAYAQLGSDDLAIHTARHQLALDPWNEEATRLLMSTLARRGQRTAALAEYERCKRVLAADLGITPSPETTAVYQHIRGESEPPPTHPETAATTPAVLPFPLTPLIGREQELTAVTTYLSRADVRLLTLLGPPGIGKTRLGLQAALELQAGFDGNVYFVALEGITDPALVTVAIARSLGFPGGSPKTSPLLRLTRELQGKPALLVLDNFEQLLPAATAVLDLLHACPQLKILVTSRAPLRLRGEQRYVLPPLPLPDAKSSPDLAENPAIRLFVARIQAILPDFTLTPENETAVAAICRRVDGLPLAIELAAARGRLLPPQRLLQQLTDASGKGLHLLKDGGQSAGQHQTLHRAIQWSYDLLGSEHQKLFARLSIFAGGFGLEAGEAVCQVGPGALDFAEAVETLLDNNLLRREETAVDEIRGVMLQTIRQFALEQLAANGERALLAGRHADYYLSLAKRAAAELSSFNQAVWLERLEADQDNMRTALEWSIEHTPEQGLELAAALFPFWHTRSYLREGRLWLDRALAGSAAATAVRARALAAAGLLAQRMGDYSRGEELAGTAVALSRQLHDQTALAYALNNLGIVLMSTGDNSRAQALAEESLAICRALDYPLGVSRALMIIGQVALHEDRLAAAQDALESSLAYWQQQGDRKNAILCLLNLGRAHMMQGDTAVARQTVSEGVELSRVVGDRHFAMVGLWTLGEIALRQADYAAAATQFGDCLAQARDIGDRYFEAITLSKQGLLAVYGGDWPRADKLLHESLALAQQIGALWCLADVLGNLGLAALRQRQTAEAASLLRESVRLFWEQGDRANTLLALERLAETAVVQQNPVQAARLLGTTAAGRAALHNPLPPNERPGQDRLLAEVRAWLGAQPFAAAWAEGEAMNLETAVQTIRGLPDSGLSRKIAP